MTTFGQRDVSNAGPSMFEDDFGAAQSGRYDPAAVEAALDAARSAGARANEVADFLTELPGSSQRLRVDGLEGVHYLQKRGVMGLDYCARVDVPGVLPRFLLTPRLLPVGAGDDVGFGDVVPFPDWAYRARTAAPGVVALFRVPELLETLGKRRCRVALRPDSDRRTVVEVDVAVGEARAAGPAVDLARQVARIARAAVDARLVFAERVDDGRPPAERVEALLARVTDAVSWVSGPVARVGDGVEARLTLEELPGPSSMLRFDIDAAGQCVVFFEGRLLDRTERVARLRPQDGLVDRLLGLVDVKIDDAAFDDAWLVDGNTETVKELAVHNDLLLRLREKHAAVELGPQGLVVRVPKFAADDTAVVEVTGAVVTLWRNLVRDARGFSAPAP